MNHYSTLPITRNRQLDVATQLRDFAGGEITLQTSELPNNMLRWHRHGEYKLVIDNHAYADYVEKTNEWAIALEGSPAVGEAYVKIATLTISGESGTVEAAVSGDSLGANIGVMVPNSSSFLRVTATPIGTPGALNYSAYLTRN